MRTLCVFKSVTTALYLDLNAEYDGEPSLKFVGKNGPILPCFEGGLAVEHFSVKKKATTTLQMIALDIFGKRQRW